MTQARDLGDAANKANFLDNVSSDIAALIASATPAGVIVPFGGTTAPSGYLACQGQIVSRSTYADLFAAIGTTWNLAGESSSEFRLPDLRGAFLRGTGSHMTHNMADGNDYAGPSVGSFENDTMLSHRHATQSWGDSGGSSPSNPTNTNAKPIRYQQIQVLRETNWGAPFTKRFTESSIHGETWTDATSTATNGYNSLNDRKGDETRPFNAGILYCIKT